MEAGIFYVLVGAVAVAAVARWRGWPAPLLVTVVALAASFLPFVPELEIDGHLLLSLVLPPLLYSAALDVSFVGFKRSLPQIRRLGIWLVLLTAFAVGLVAWWILPSLTLPGALLLGAIVAPPDAVSAAAIGRRLGLPRRIMTVLSGESLINDATSLTLYRVFAAILAGATVSIGGGVGQFLLAVGVGVGIGLVFGIVLHQLRMRIGDPVVIGTFGLLAPFGAYNIAEHLLGSGVLAVVAMGLFVGFNAPRTDYTTRQQEAPLWLSADLLLESFVFAYIGLQFPRVLNDLGSESVGHILLLSGAVLLVVLVVRPLYIYPISAWSNSQDRRRLARMDRGIASGEFDERRRRSRRWRDQSTDELRTQIVRERMAGLRLTWKDNAVISWAGMRGVVTLAIAVAAADLAGLDTEAAHAIVVVAFIVTVGTLLLQGLTLPLLIRRLEIAGDEEHEEDVAALETVKAKSREAGKAYLAEKRREWEQKHGEVDLGMFDAFTKRMTRVEKDTDDAQQVEDTVARPSYDDLVALTKGWLQVRREILVAERDAGELDEEVMRELLAAMDAEELALDTRGATRPLSRS
ncbi:MULTISPECIES: cation:proton antiporter [unclassified Microbacterium]|uniref:cation:proton antiporter n=1 Tax=unclassified Microbacterium TaxID=2609290 RepID=UPI002469596A|nr:MULTISPECIES: cation:proton antiporter [unclassified Microbacterium]MDH5133161.1 cation:proton antiporter [Microbacterium sp. RD10]MDH5137501.1 cation:proton antiporter [Microbacterium sp. RD11]MDH5145014.1 cation:proton antiporter [Microbacterium sp. RD12]MDH5155073.1 cation:proton antiporter [Microbacterium sp. RD06]MDH5166021.1 cation:proton antiporter [Microbacterium sp. RD02]